MAPIYFFSYILCSEHITHYLWSSAFFPVARIHSIEWCSLSLLEMVQFKDCRCEFLYELFYQQEPKFHRIYSFVLGDGVTCRVYLKCLDTLLEWVPHTKTKKKVHINTCWQKNSLCGTVQQCAELNLLDFYLSGHLKTLAYSAPIENRDTLHQHIYDVCQTIHNCPRTFQNVRESVIRHIHLCTVSSRGHFEHLKWITTW